MTNSIVLFILSLLFIKHFLADFPLQSPYQWMNKGTYGHMGGILHSFLHALFSFGILVPWFGLAALPAVIVEFVLHYHIDWAKMNINDFYGWKCNQHSEFWALLGFDQFLHTATYIGMVAYLVN